MYIKKKERDERDEREKERERCIYKEARLSLSIQGWRPERGKGRVCTCNKRGLRSRVLTRLNLQGFLGGIDLGSLFS